jgi:hypothetical protein
MFIGSKNAMEAIQMIKKEKTHKETKSKQAKIRVRDLKGFELDEFA